jgi:hypothetical protein
MSGRMRLLAGRLRLERVRIGEPELIVVKCHESVGEERVAACLREAIGPDYSRHLIVRRTMFGDDAKTRSEIRVSSGGIVKGLWT